MIKFFEKLLNLIYFRRCAGCGKTTTDEFICSDCYSKIRFLNSLSDRKDFICDVYVCAVYEKVVKKLILDIKYSGKRYLSGVCSDLLDICFKKNKLCSDYVVIPVPVHKNRKRQRRYNHMDLIADDFCKKNNLKCFKNFVVRIKDTDRQFNLDTKQRIKNIKDAFSVNKNLKLLPDKNTPFLILDDIVSSGATVNEITSLLKSEGYNKVSALVISMPELNR